MPIRALAADYDGTLATHGEAPDFVAAALERLKASGRRLALVTGRRLPVLHEVFARIDLFDIVVAENGALLYRPGLDEAEPLATKPPAAFIAALARRNVEPLALGRTIVAADASRVADLLGAIAEAGIDWRVILNKDSAMCLPRGVDKASGLRHALRALDLPADDVVGVGDAENDLTFLALCGVAAAVAGAAPQVKAAADLVTEGDAGAGVAWLIERILEGADFPTRRVDVGR
ncbi:MAG TPA: HAD family hydrolase [Caulobacteraceae bacterium]|nr:HAD family hydrolase [Caulobacteraceae bacterium]